MWFIVPIDVLTHSLHSLIVHPFLYYAFSLPNLLAYFLSHEIKNFDVIEFIMCFKFCVFLKKGSLLRVIKYFPIVSINIYRVSV